MFTGDEKLSKLSIALDYEDRAANLQSEPSKEAQETMELLRSLMQLRGEMSAEKSVFEEVSKSG